MSMKQSIDNIAALLTKGLNIHGFSYQYSILKLAEQMRKHSKTDWSLIAAEFPVESRGNPGHIDFVLTDNYRENFLVSECKRADPARANWCFAKAPYTWRNSYDGYVQFDKIFDSNLPSKLFRKLTTTHIHTDRKVVHLGLEIKTNDKGDGEGSVERSAINSAVGQVLRNTSGLLDYYYKTLPAADSGKTRTSRFIPVIFTTARLFVTDTNIGTSDILTGKLPTNELNVEEVDWLWFNENRSTSLASENSLAKPEERFPSNEYYEFMRSVAIVSSSSIENFFNTGLSEWFADADRYF